MQAMGQYPVFISEEWAHVLAWDLFVRPPLVFFLLLLFFLPLLLLLLFLLPLLYDAHAGM
jgi:hypothetical protein